MNKTGIMTTIDVSDEAMAYLMNKKRHLKHRALVMANKDGRRTIWDEEANEAYDRGETRGGNAELAEICRLLGIMPELLDNPRGWRVWALP